MPPLSQPTTSQPSPASVVLHEVVAGAGFGVNAAAFGLALGLEARAQGGRPKGALLWARTENARREMGLPYGPGLSAFGCPPHDLTIAHLKKDIDVWRAGLEGIRCDALAAVLMETDAAADLTTTRRFKLAAEKSGVAVILVRHDRTPATNAARVRWLVRAAHPPNPPQRHTRARPAFDVVPLKHPSGVSDCPLRLEWDCDRLTFIDSGTGSAALSRALAALPARRPLAA